MSKEKTIDLYKDIDKERIIKALENGKRNDAYVLFEYSALTKEEFMELKEKHLYNDDFIKQMKDYIKENEKKKIAEALKENCDHEAEVLLKFSDHLDQQDFIDIQKKQKSQEKGIEDGETDDDLDWKKVLSVISSKISRPSFDTWLKGLYAQEQDNKLIIFCHNEFQKEWAEERYSSLINDIIEQLYSRRYELIFEVEKKRDLL